MISGPLSSRKTKLSFILKSLHLEKQIWEHLSLDFKNVLSQTSEKKFKKGSFDLGFSLLICFWLYEKILLS